MQPLAATTVGEWLRRRVARGVSGGVAASELVGGRSANTHLAVCECPP